MKSVVSPNGLVKIGKIIYKFDKSTVSMLEDPTCDKIHQLVMGKSFSDKYITTMIIQQKGEISTNIDSSYSFGRDGGYGIWSRSCTDRYRRWKVIGYLDFNVAWISGRGIGYNLTAKVRSLKKVWWANFYLDCDALISYNYGGTSNISTGEWMRNLSSPITNPRSVFWGVSESSGIVFDKTIFNALPQSQGARIGSYLKLLPNDFGADIQSATLSVRWRNPENEKDVCQCLAKFPQ